MPRDPAGGSLRVIIIEDEFVIARSLMFLLESHDCRVVGMAATVQEALQLIDTEAFDAAIVDIDLKGTSAAPVAEELLRRQARFVFLTGYGNLEMLPEHLREQPHLEKPVESHLLLSALRRSEAAGSS